MTSEPERPYRRSRRILITGLVLVTGMILGVGATLGYRSGRVEAAGETSPVAARPPMATSSPFVDVAEAVLPAVVSVESRRLFQHPPVSADSTDDLSQFGLDGEITVPSSGSGFLIDREGHVLTNNHVIAGASSIWVHLADGRQMAADLIGTDPSTDVAVLRITADGPLPTVPMGNSDEIKIGDWVAAVGNPLGVLEGSLTVGVVSAKGRSEIEISGSSPSYQDFIQTDAAINFGNSGGPLVNSRGEAIGINTAFGGPGRGIGFAVSINLAREVAQALIENGRVVRGYLGVVLQRMDGPLATGLGVPGGRGVLVREVQDSTPAMAAGLQPGDVIIGFDGAEVKDMPTFRLLVARTAVNRRVPMTVHRHGKNVESTVVLAERPDLDSSLPPPQLHPQSMQHGLKLASLPEDAALEDEDSTRAVLISDVASGSLAMEAGLQSGDAILEVDGHGTVDPDSCLEFINHAAALGRPAVLRVQRGPERWFVAIPFTKSMRP